jgi:hypothetical protein
MTREQFEALVELIEAKIAEATIDFQRRVSDDYGLGLSERRRVNAAEEAARTLFVEDEQ